METWLKLKHFFLCDSKKKLCRKIHSVSPNINKLHEGQWSLLHAWNPDFLSLLYIQELNSIWLLSVKVLHIKHENEPHEQFGCSHILHELFDFQLLPVPESLCENDIFHIYSYSYIQSPESLCGKLTCTTTTSRRSGRERRKQGGRCQKSEQSIKIKISKFTIR